MVSSPGGLTSVVQTFSTLDVRMERLEFSDQRDGQAMLGVQFAADERTADLLCRKLAKLIEVISVESALMIEE